MRLLLILACLLFAALPYEAQLAIVGVLRSLPPEIWLGALGSSLAAMFWYSLGWNSLAAQQRDQAVEKAEQAYRQTRR